MGPVFFWRIDVLRTKACGKRIRLLTTSNVRKANIAWRAVILRRTNYALKGSIHGASRSPYEMLFFCRVLVEPFGVGCESKITGPFGLWRTI